LAVCCQVVYVKPASGNWSPLNLRFVPAADYLLKAAGGPTTVVVNASQSRKNSELLVRRWYTSKF
jgi:hypothetical protein